MAAAAVNGGAIAMDAEEMRVVQRLARRLARRIYRKAQLPQWMADDDAHDLWTDFCRSGSAPWLDVQDAQHRKALRIRTIKARLRNTARHRWTLQERISVTGLSVDEAPFGDYDDDGNENNIESALIADAGRHAELIRSFECPDPEPEWILLTRQLVAEILNDSSPRNYALRRVCRALMTSRTITAARQKSCVSDWKIRGILKKFKVRFAQCFRAYRASRHLKKPTKK